MRTSKYFNLTWPDGSTLSLTPEQAMKAAFQTDGSRTLMVIDVPGTAGSIERKRGDLIQASLAALRDEVAALKGSPSVEIVDARTPAETPQLAAPAKDNGDSSNGATKPQQKKRVLLTAAQWRQLLKEASEGTPVVSLAAQYGVAANSIYTKRSLTKAAKSNGAAKSKGTAKLNATAKPKTKTKGNARFSDADWHKILKECDAGKLTIAEVGDKWKVAKSAIYTHRAAARNA